MRETLKKYSNKIIALLCAVIVLLLVLGDFSGLFAIDPWANTRRVEINVDRIEGLSEEIMEQWSLPFEHGLTLAENPILSDFRMTASHRGHVLFSGTLEYSDRTIEIEHIPGIPGTMYARSHLSNIYVVTGRTDRHGFRVLHFELTPEAGSILIQSFETREIMWFIFELDGDEYSRLLNATPNRINDIIMEGQLDLSRESFLPALEREVAVTPE